MLGVNVVVADARDEAAFLFTSHQQAFVNLRRGTPGPLPPPSMQAIEALRPQERWDVDETLSVAMVGTSSDVQRLLEDFVARTKADELIIVSQIYDHAARLRSYELASRIREQMAVG
jgi:alkanesulfonate monooxygenase SsuD/methylene tetrahydromethanopterin reductase-like flavin-dependent oxidoreductase (luciferase family)